MSVKADALRIIEILATYEQFSGDSQRGRYYADGRSLTQATGFDEDRINDAVAYLEKEGLVEGGHPTGTWPFDFDGVELTVDGRARYEFFPESAGSNDAAANEAMVRVFISHSSHDAEIVRLLIALVRSALNIPGAQIRCTSVDGYRLPGGADTNARLRQEVNEATVLLGVLSPASLNSLYVVFELGARWGSGKTFIPLLAPGTSVAALGGPLSGMNALRLDNEPQIHQLLSEIGQYVKRDVENPAVYKPQLDSFLLKAESLQAAAISAGLESAEPEDLSVVSTNVLDGGHQITIPCALASYYFATEPDGETCVLNDCLVLVCAREISEMRAILPILEQVARSGRPLLVVAPRVMGDALPTLIMNTQVGRLRACVVTPSPTADPSALFRLVARGTSATVFHDEAALHLESATLGQLGRARRAETRQGVTVITKESPSDAAPPAP
jgi:hypothetical protein